MNYDHYNPGSGKHDPAIDQEIAEGEEALRAEKECNCYVAGLPSSAWEEHDPPHALYCPERAR